ncbi:MAG: hypothetical protein AAFX85_13045 [Pseudomonadota bacterium]
MSEYLPLLRIAVKNTYFQNGDWRGIGFTPLGSTAAWIDGHRVLVQAIGNRLALYVRQDLIEGLRDRARHDGGLALAWGLEASDAAAHHFTEIPNREGHLLVFEGTSEAERLHGGAAVDTASLVAIDDARLEPWLGPREVRVPPLGLVLLNLSVAFFDEVGEAGRFAHDSEICFDARATYWQYYVHGHDAHADAHITDAASEHRFRFLGRQLLEGREAAVYRSEDPIALQERPTTQLQLRAKGETDGANGRVLVAHLPQPSARQLLRRPESTQRGEALLSEVFVYL